MAMYIDLYDSRNYYIGEDGEYQKWNIDPRVIEEATDVVEVVRCKNCVFWEEHDGFGKCIEPTSVIKSDVWLNPLFYCRAAVKRDGETE